MQSRRDQVQAQSYMLNRLTAALVMAEPEALENPHRRVFTGMIAGLLIGALIMGVFVVFGFLQPGGAKRWREPGTVIVEKETGGRFVLLDGQLRPIYNYTSAALIFGKRPALVNVSTASLKSVSRGLPIGIIGAPDSPPDPTGMTDVEWSVCALAGTDQTGTAQTGTLLTLTRRAATPVDDGNGFTVTAPSGQLFLIWKGQRFALTEPWIARVLGYAAAAPPVAANWLNQLPPGPDITSVDVVGRGEAGPVVDARPTRVGQVFVVRVVDLPDRYFLLLRDGLSTIGATAVALVLGTPGTATAYAGAPVRPIELTAGALARLPMSRQQLLPAGLPERPPTQADLPAKQTWCVRRPVPDGPAVITKQTIPTVAVDGDSPGISRTQQTATAVLAAPGVGGLVRQNRAGQAGGTSYFLLTDAGVKFPIGTADAAKALGYSLDQSRTVPAALLSLLPTGPVLDLIPATR